jgi:hypothetical protein
VSEAVTRIAGAELDASLIELSSPVTLEQKFWIAETIRTKPTASIRIAANVSQSDDDAYSCADIILPVRPINRLAPGTAKRGLAMIGVMAPVRFVPIA